MAFNLADILAECGPESGTNREQIEYLSLDQLDNDPNNFYELRDIETLADNIATCGLQQPIRVRKHPETEGRYIIVSGHRRRAALEELRKEEPEKWSEAPCIVEADEASESLRQLRLIYANAHTRHLTSAEIGEQAVQVEKLLYQLKEEGHQFPGRMRDHVAQAVGASKSKISRLNVIRERLIPNWMELFQRDELPESTAYALAQLEPEWQNLMYNHYGSTPSRLYCGHAENVKNVVDKVSQIDCRAYKGSKCLIPSERKKHIVGLGQYDSWSCSLCCLDCSSLATCKDSCYLASMEKEYLIQKKKDEKTAQEAAEKERIAPTLELIRGIYGRWDTARKQKGLTAEDYLRACGRTWLGSDAKDFEKYAAHPEKVKAEQTKLPFTHNMWPADVLSLTSAADVLGCSIDWLLGREGYPGPGEEVQNVPESGTGQNGPGSGPGWQTGEPDKPGKYVVVISCCGHLTVDTLRWSDGWMYDEFVSEADPILFWISMPEE